MDPIHSQAEEAAARAIQRVYRYHRVRNHFRDIVMLARAREGNGTGRRIPRKSLFRPVQQKLTGCVRTPPGHRAAKPTILRTRPSNMGLGPRMSLADFVTDSPNALARTASIAVSASERDYIAGIYEFCYKPEKGISLLIESGAIENNEIAVAEFLASEKRLNKAKVGDYLGTGYAFASAARERRSGSLTHLPVTFFFGATSVDRPSPTRSSTPLSARLIFPASSSTWPCGTCETPMQAWARQDENSDVWQQPRLHGLGGRLFVRHSR